jgi:hypothetical protein
VGELKVRFSRVRFVSLIPTYAGVWTLIVAQPVLQLASKSPEFFVAHALGPVAMIITLASMILVPPLVLAALTALASIVSKGLGKLLIYLLLSGLVGLFVLQAAGSTVGTEGLVFAYALAVVAGLLTGWVHQRTPAIQSFVKVLSISVIAVPVWFAIFTPAASLFTVPPISVDNQANVQVSSANLPIVIVVFDELPLTQMIDVSGRFDPALYPNFAAFSGQAHWFQNAVSVATSTMDALPALLTGNSPFPKSLPDNRHYPGNLLAWLSGLIPYSVTESGTQLCGERCRPRISLGERALAIAADMTIILGHVALPDAHKKLLPDITSTWNDFANLIPGPQAARNRDDQREDLKEHIRLDRRERFRDALAAFDTHRPGPGLYYIHVPLPHVPAIYLPSGLSYVTTEEMPGAEVEQGHFVGQEEAMLHLQHRTLLQIQMVDRLLGELLNKLRSDNLYEDAFIVVLSDHGRSFRVGAKSRSYSNGNSAELLAIPLLVKFPHQTVGGPRTENVDIRDVAPTIAQVLGLSLPWRPDGTSLAAPIPPREGRIPWVPDEHATTFEDLAKDKRLVAASREESFIHLDHLDTLARRLPWSHLVGGRIDEFPVRTGSFNYTVDQASLFERVKLDSGFIPAQITGSINVGSHQLFAAILNGRIAAIMKAFPSPAGNRYAAILPERLFREGTNSLELLAINNEEASPQFVRPTEMTPTSAPKKVPRTISYQGKAFEIRDKPQMVRLRRIFSRYRQAHFVGIAADADRAIPLDLVIIFVDGEPVYWAAPNIVNESAATRLNVSRDTLLGFRASLPRSLVLRHPNAGLELYALSFADGVAWRGRISNLAACNWKELLSLQDEDYDTAKAQACGS